MEQSGGLIGWHDLMRVPIFSESHGFAILGEMAKAERAIVGLQEEAAPLGKILYPSPQGKKLGERTGAIGSTGWVTVGRELTDPGGVTDDEAGRLQLAGVMAIEGAKVIFENQGFLHAFLRGLKHTIRRPVEAVDSIAKRNDAAKPQVELERLRMAINDNIVTSEVRANGLGGVEASRLDESIYQIGLVYSFKTKPKADDIFDASFLPPADKRKMN